MNELICSSRYCKVSLLDAFGSSPYRFPLFGAPFNVKKSASQEDSYMKSLAGFSTDVVDARFPYQQEHLAVGGWELECQNTME